MRLSTPPRLSASVNSSAAFEDLSGTRFAAVENDRNHAAEMFHLAARKGMLAVGLQAGIVHPQHIAAAGKPFGYLLGVLAMAMHA